jgi:hypothetical protein
MDPAKKKKVEIRKGREEKSWFHERRCENLNTLSTRHNSVASPSKMRELS